MINPLAEHLEKYPLFGGLSDEELGFVADRLIEKRFAAGEIIIREGETGDRVYCLLSGEVKVLKCIEGLNDLIEVARLPDGSTFGEMELIDMQARSATIEALGECRTVSLSNKDLLHILHDNQHIFTIIMMNLARDLSRRIRTLDHKLCELTKKDGLSQKENLPFGSEDV